MRQAWAHAAGSLPRRRFRVLVAPLGVKVLTLGWLELPGCRSPARGPALLLALTRSERDALPPSGHRRGQSPGGRRSHTVLSQLGPATAGRRERRARQANMRRRLPRVNQRAAACGLGCTNAITPTRRASARLGAFDDLRGESWSRSRPGRAIGGFARAEPSRSPSALVAFRRAARCSGVAPVLEDGECSGVGALGGEGHGLARMSTAGRVNGADHELLRRELTLERARDHVPGHVLDGGVQFEGAVADWDLRDRRGRDAGAVVVVARTRRWSFRPWRT